MILPFLQGRLLELLREELPVRPASTNAVNPHFQELADTPYRCSSCRCTPPAHTLKPLFTGFLAMYCFMVDRP